MHIEVGQHHLLAKLIAGPQPEADWERARSQKPLGNEHGQNGPALFSQEEQLLNLKTYCWPAGRLGHGSHRRRSTAGAVLAGGVAAAARSRLPAAGGADWGAGHSDTSWRK